MEILFGGRYVLLLMAIFSMYCELIYIEFFSVPFHIFVGSAYKHRDATCRKACSSVYPTHVNCFSICLSFLSHWRGNY